MSSSVSKLTAEQHKLVYLEQKEKEQNVRRELRCQETKAHRENNLAKGARNLKNIGIVPSTIWRCEDLRKTASGDEHPDAVFDFFCEK